MLKDILAAIGICYLIWTAVFLLSSDLVINGEVIWKAVL